MDFHDEQEGLSLPERRKTAPQGPAEPDARGHLAATEAAPGLTDESPKPRRARFLSGRGRCRFCRDKVDYIDYKDLTTLRSLLRGRGRLMSRQRSGNCSLHQRMVKKAVKRARFIGLMSYDESPPRGGTF